MRTLRAIAWSIACAACASASCGDAAPPPPTRLAAGIHAQTRDGHDVPGVRLWADGRELGTTDAAGKLSATLSAPEGARVVVTAACPSAFRTLDERRELAVRPLRAAAGQQPGPSLQLSVTCEPLELLAALVVRARGERVAGLPLRVHDQVVGQTGPDGTAHILLRARPDASLTVELDTSREPALEPRSPVQTFQLGKQPSVLLFEPSLERASSSRRRPRAARPGVGRASAGTPGRLPYRVD